MTVSAFQRTRSTLVIVVMLLATLGFGVVGTPSGAAASPSILYVDSAVGTPGDGSTWSLAYATLQHALSYATSNSGTQFEIWVAQGDYYPTTGTDRTISFDIPVNVSAYGGFAGGETDRSQRDWNAHSTILNGDIGTLGDNSDNSYRVVTFGAGVTNANVLDGFVITNGNANEPFDFNNPFAPVEDSGAGIYLTGGASPWLSNLDVNGNMADNAGGGIYSSFSSPWAEHLFIHDNSAFAGGGVFVSGGSPWLESVVVSGNTASRGAGLVVGDSDTFVMVNGIISGNRAVNSTGFDGDGAGVMFQGSNASDTPTIINSTITGNYAERFNAGVYATSFVSPHIANSIVWGNADMNGSTGDSEFFHDVFGGTTFINFAIVQGGCPGGAHACNNVMDVDPLFVNSISPLSAPTTAGDFRLGIDSPAIDAGDNSLVPNNVTTDIVGFQRIFDNPLKPGTGPVVDLGAYEAPAPASTPGVNVTAIASTFGTTFFSHGTSLTVMVTTNAQGIPSGYLSLWSGNVLFNAYSITAVIVNGNSVIVLGEGHLLNGQQLMFRFDAAILNTFIGGENPMHVTLSNGFNVDTSGRIVVR